MTTTAKPALKGHSMSYTSPLHSLVNEWRNEARINRATFSANTPVFQSSIVLERLANQLETALDRGFHCHCETDNQAFQEGSLTDEVEKILRYVAADVEPGCDGNCVDSNGNIVGYYSLGKGE
jgi:hypothetical protein